MPEAPIVHYGIDIDHSAESRITQLACNEWSPADVEWTRDPDDTTCNNCLRTLEWEQAKAAKHPSVVD